VLAPLSLLGIIVACLSAAGSVEQIIDAAPLATLAMALALPVALVRTLDWTALALRRLAGGFWIVAAALLLALVVPAPGTGAVTDHVKVVLLLVASTVAGAILAGGSPRALLREISESA
jgi:hypothetical protein